MKTKVFENRLLFEEIKLSAKKMKEPENFMVFRLFVLFTILTAIVAVLFAREWPSQTPVLLLGTCAGFISSWYTRARKNVFLKIVISILMLYALRAFFRELTMSVYEPAIPVTNLLLWLQLLHSFDLPTRRDLNYSVVVSIVLITAGAFISRSDQYVVFLFVFLVFIVITLYLSSLSYTMLMGSGKTFRVPPRAFQAAFAVLLLAFAPGYLLFVAVPRADQLEVRMYSLEHLRLFDLTQRNLNSGGLTESEIRGRSNLRSLNSSNNTTGYFGFASVMDLNHRGKLSDEIVMKVKCSYNVYYKGVVFTDYTGSAWNAKQEPSHTYEYADPPVIIPAVRAGKKRVVQIFSIERDLPNIVYGANDVSELYIPGGTVYADSNKTIIAPYFLESGMVYTCVSYLPTEESLGDLERFEENSDVFQLPYEKITPRLREFARSFDDHTSDKGRRNYYLADKICRHLQNSYAYDLEVEKFPEDSEFVDYFLFETKRGFCEHFATSMVILCRLNGIPARLVTGFLPGEYNFLTGTYEVKESHAHAWVEVHDNTKGWILYDPTPGYNANPGAHMDDGRQSAASKWVSDAMSRLFHNLDKFFLKLSGGRNDLRINWSSSFWGYVFIFGFLIVVVLLNKYAGLIRLPQLRLHLQRSPYRRIRLELPRSSKAVVKKFLQLEAALERKFGKRDFSVTPGEYMGSLALPDSLRELLDRYLALYHRARFGDGDVGVSAVQEGNRIFDEIRKRLRTDLKS